MEASFSSASQDLTQGDRLTGAVARLFEICGSYCVSTLKSDTFPPQCRRARRKCGEVRMSDGVDLSIGQFRDAWRLWCEGSATRSLANEEGIDYIFSGVPISFFNVALLTGRDLSADALKGQGERACAWAADKNVPWLFVMTHERLQPGVDADSVLDGCGLGRMMTLTGMLTSEIAPGRPVPDGLTLVVPQDDSGCSSVLDVNSAAYGMDLDLGKDLIGTRSFWTGHVPVLGMVDGKPACAAAVVMVDGCRYVALVATDPSISDRLCRRHHAAGFGGRGPAIRGRPDRPARH